MKKKVVFFMMLFLLVGALFFVESNEESLEKIDRKILEKFDSGESNVKVIVSFKEEITEKGKLGLTKDREIDKKDLTKIYGIEDKVKHKFLDSNSFSAELTFDEIRELEESGMIERISYDYPVNKFLQESVPLINATSSWSLQSEEINLTGIGQTVCIIDTGVYFTHPALVGKNLTCNIDCYNKDCIEDCSFLDVDGHGTHVAGIVGAFGEINGTAVGTKLIGVNVFPTVGSTSISNVIAGITWCVDHVEDYNISVISMSLGGDAEYNEYCNSDDTADSINRAILKNVSVVVATGNDNSSIYISSPACVENATRVGMTYDKNYGPLTWSSGGDIICSDSGEGLVCWGNRNSLVNLVAPGAIINSTWKNNLYEQTQGTSMSTPHVSGAIAILRQYLNSIEKILTPKQIEDVLNITGKQIYDSASSRYYSRIDVYSALMYLDETPPIVNLSFPSNSEVNLTQNKTFSCNSTDWQLKNTTLLIWNSLGEIYHNSTTNEISGMENLTEFNVSELDYGAYNWNCLSCDINSNCAFAESNFSLFILPENVSTEQVSPEDQDYTNENEISFVCKSFSGIGFELKNISLEVFYTENMSNISLFNYSEKIISGIYNLSEFLINFSSAEEGEYNWSCISVNNESNFSTTENRTIIYDITAPSLEGSVQISKNYNSATISFETDEQTNSSIELFSKENNFTSQHSFSVSGLSASTSYNFNITFCDRAGNCNFSENSFTTDNAPDVTPSGGGGSSSSSTTKSEEILELKSINVGRTIGVKKQNKVSFSIRGTTHTLEILELKSNSIYIVIRSNPINLTLLIGEERKLNISSKDYYDLYIKLNNITSEGINITLREILEKIEQDEEKDESLDGGKSEENILEFDSRNFEILGVFVLVVILIVFLANKIYKMKLKKKILNKKNKKSGEDQFYFLRKH